MCWRLAFFHLMLCIQKKHKTERKNKGHTVIVCDHEHIEESFAAKIVRNPPEWSDTFYRHVRKVGKRPSPPLNQIVDVPYFADSKHVLLLQVADLFAYLLRLHAELQLGYRVPKYKGETEKVAAWAKQIGTIATPDSNRWPAVGGCNCSNFYRSLAPNVLLTLFKDSRA